MKAVTITRQAYAARYNIEKALLTKRDFDAAIEKLQSGRESQKPYIKAQIVKMLKMLDIDCELSMNDEYYINIVSKLNLPDKDIVVEKIFPVLYDNFTKFPSPTAYMKQIIDWACDNEPLFQKDKWQKDSLRLRILKQFIKYGNILTYSTTVMDDDGKEKKKKITIYQGEMYIKKYVSEKLGKRPKNNDEIIENVDDDIFDVLNVEGTVPEKYELLKICDDLATGKFRVSGVTKKALYLFAMVYNMKYDTGSLLDVERVLFQNYYNNNLMRFISDYYVKNLSSFEIDPSGIGINYKNFAEMVYIYFIASDRSIEEKIKLSNEMIEELKEKKVSDESKVKSDSVTEFYRRIVTMDIIRLSTEDFKKFIIENYDRSVCFSKISKKGDTYIEKISPIQLNSSQKTAYSLYKELIKKISDIGIDVSTCDYGLWFKDQPDRKMPKEEKKSPKMKEFLRLLRGINMFLSKKSFNVKSEKEITRTAIVTAYYYYYNAINEKNNSIKSLSEVFREYTTGADSLNDYLEKAHYQGIDEKNIFDMAVILSSFSYLYELR